MLPGIWTPGGVSSDGKSVFAVTGNTEGATTYSDGNGVFKFQSGPVFRATSPNYFAPSQWKQYDNDDIDLCGSEPVVLDLPGETLLITSAGTGMGQVRVTVRNILRSKAQVCAHWSKSRLSRVCVPCLTGSMTVACRAPHVASSV